MSRGPGTPSRDLTKVVLCSSRMMSMQSSTHSSQINTVGPAISFLTSCWLFPAGPIFDYLVENPELLRLERRQELVAFHRGGNGFERLASVSDINLVEPRPKRQDLARLDLDVRGLTLRAARRLVDHDPRIRQRKPLAFGPGAQQQGPHRGGL